MRLLAGGPSSGADSPGAGRDADLDHARLADLYAYPGAPAAPFVRMNFVSSADGAVSAGGVSAGLHAPGDAKVFGLLRELADVILAGAGTVRDEGYRGARTSPELRARRRDRGQSEVPPIAVVTSCADLDPGSALFTDTTVPPLILTTTEAAARARQRLGSAGAEVVAASADDPAAVDTDTMLAALADRGLVRVLCEGGPGLFGTLLDADRVDELCLSLAPQLAGPGAARIIAGVPSGTVAELRLAAVIDQGSGLLLRYRTRRGDTAALDRP